MPQREWTTKQLRGLPELRHLAPDDPALVRWNRRQWIPQVLSLGVFLSIAVPTWILALVCIAETMDSNASYSARQLQLLTFSSLVLFLGSFPLALLGGAFGAFLAYRIGLRKLRTELRRRGIPICIRCGYQAGDIAAHRCPECGAPAP
jgi:hypothetical protein